MVKDLASSSYSAKSSVPGRSAEHRPRPLRERWRRWKKTFGHPGRIDAVNEFGQLSCGEGRFLVASKGARGSFAPIPETPPWVLSVITMASSSGAAKSEHSVKS